MTLLEPPRPHEPPSAASAARPALITPRMWVIAALAGILAIFTLVIPATDLFDVPSVPAPSGLSTEGTVLAVVDEGDRDAAVGGGRFQELAVEVDGEEVAVRHEWSPGGLGPQALAPGEDVVLGYSEVEGERMYHVADHVRRVPLLLLGLALAVVVLAVGWVQGFWSLVGMAASFLVIIRYVVPGILSGADPVAVAVSGSLVIMLVTLYLAHGVSRKTTIALGGTAASLLLTAVVSGFAIEFARLSGISGEDAVTLQILSEGSIDATGLLLAAIIIGSLGVLDDVTVAQTSSVFELRRANRRLGALELYRRAMNIGRDHIASTVNTLVLAYAGVSLPLLIVLSTQAEPLEVLVNREFLATEIVRTVVGSIGIVAAVPITTALAAIVAARTRPALPARQRGEPGLDPPGTLRDRKAPGVAGAVGGDGNGVPGAGGQRLAGDEDDRIPPAEHGPAE